MGISCTLAPTRPYTFLELTRALCPDCLQIVDAKLVLQNDKVYMVKHCREHGSKKVLVSTDYAYWRQTRQFVKPGQMPLQWNTPIEHGCPYDCGLCPDHEQHSCVTLVEITDRCNLTCPTCFAGSSPTAGSHRTLAQVEAMLDAVVRNEGQPDVVQISGGEPTIHPQFFEILDAAKARPIQHVMVNTNGLRIANDAAFAERLATYAPGLEIYLQFDSLTPHTQHVLRGEDLTAIRLKALERLNALNLSTTLVCVVRKDLNAHEVGDILRFAQAQPCVRGVTFQPVQEAGRTEQYSATTDRLTLTEIRTAILEQYPTFTPADMLPVPCHPDCLSMAYGLKHEGKVLPLSHFVDPAALLIDRGDTNTIAIRSDFKQKLFELFALNHSPQSGSEGLGSLLCCLPEFELPVELGYNNIFRVLIVDFMDVNTLDIRSVKRSCIHIVHPETLHVIPFDTYNLFYRPGLSRPDWIKPAINGQQATKVLAHD
jgi:7,8-dihydro-6-hydroxymethylpterin dimethyltransferase